VRATLPALLAGPLAATRRPRAPSAPDRWLVANVSGSRQRRGVPRQTCGGSRPTIRDEPAGCLVCDQNSGCDPTPHDPDSWSPEADRARIRRVA